MRIFEAFTVIWTIILAGLLLVFCLMFPSCAHAKDIDINKLADAIYISEGGSKTKHPYGILTKYKTTTPRQACINTIKTGLRKWNGQGSFIEFLGKTYCPVGASNDPTGLNKYWFKNVTYHYNNLTRGEK